MLKCLFVWYCWIRSRSPPKIIIKIVASVTHCQCHIPHVQKIHKKILLTHTQRQKHNLLGGVIQTDNQLKFEAEEEPKVPWKQCMWAGISRLRWEKCDTAEFYSLWWTKKSARIENGKLAWAKIINYIMTSNRSHRLHQHTDVFPSFCRRPRQLYSRLYY